MERRSKQKKSKIMTNSTNNISADISMKGQTLEAVTSFNTISFVNMSKLYKSLVTSILLYGYDTWTLFADSEKKDPAFLRISYLELKTNTGCGTRSTSLWVHRNLFW